MTEIKWNPVKSEKLKQTRGISFEKILDSKLVDIRKHPQRKDQKVSIFEYRGYLWAVPTVMENDIIFLKTIYPSRKLMKLHGKEKNNEKN